MGRGGFRGERDRNGAMVERGKLGGWFYVFPAWLCTPLSIRHVSCIYQELFYYMVCYEGHCLGAGEMVKWESFYSTSVSLSLNSQNIPNSWAYSGRAGNLSIATG